MIRGSGPNCRGSTTGAPASSTRCSITGGDGDISLSAEYAGSEGCGRLREEEYDEESISLRATCDRLHRLPQVLILGGLLF